MNKTGATFPIDSQKVDNKGNASLNDTFSSLFSIDLTISSILSNPPNLPKWLIKLINKSDLHFVLYTAKIGVFNSAPNTSSRPSSTGASSDPGIAF